MALDRIYKWMTGIAAGAAGLVALDALVLERYLFKVKTFNLQNERYKSKYFRMILLTDLHLQDHADTKYRRLADKINYFTPDILLIAGDAIDEDGRAGTLSDFLSLIRYNMAKVAILGNHEYKTKAKISTIRKIYKRHGVDLLVNESKAYPIRDTVLMITGLDDIVEVNNGNFSKAVEGVGHEKQHIALIHTPVLQDQVRSQLRHINKDRQPEDRINISFIFAGHNHGGQVTLFGHPLLLPKKSGNYVGGWYNEDKPYLYVSKGFGTSTVPLRLGARAEMTVFNYYYG